MILSKLRPVLVNISKNQGASRLMSGDHHATFPLSPSRWQWRKFKDLLHFYIMLGFIPCVGIITAANVFVGPATLSEIPPDYVPKYWEYYKSPVTRFIAKYILPSPQQDYEKFLTYLYIENEKKQLRWVENQVKEKLKERNDYQAYYYRPVMAKYHRISKEASEQLQAIRGD